MASGRQVEAIKRASRGLRGGVGAAVHGEATHFAAGDEALIKFHGLYQGVDRDTATSRKQTRLEKQWQFMVRARIPAGRLTAAQYLALDALAEAHGGGALRITTRQGIQFHGVAKGDLVAVLRAIDAAMLTTLAACGDVVRNVVATPAPIEDEVHRTLQREAARLSRELLPATRAYHEIWVDGDAWRDHEADSAGTRDELYGEGFLPRKFKIGLATPQDNGVDVLTNDLALIALFEGQALAGYNLAVGGGLGMTHNKPQTYPRLATIVAFVPPEDLLAATRAVVGLQRDHGDRGERKHARLKYLVAEKGVDWVRGELAARLGRMPAPPRAMPRFAVVDHMGWHAQGDGRLWLGLPIANGRIKDTPEIQLRTALRRIVVATGARPVLAPSQDILLADLRLDDRERVESILREHGVALPWEIAPVARWAMACPALPSCSQALNEAERIRVSLVAEIEDALARHGLGRERISVRITGCPNGCARPYTGDIGIVGRTPDDYAIYLGGDFEGTRLNRLVFARVPLDRVAATLDPLFAAFACERAAGESFGDFCHRRDDPALLALAAAPASALEPA